MKKTTKVLLTLVCAVLLAAASVMGTLAYLTDHDSVNNTFTVGQVHIKLDEAPVDANGKATTGDRVKENTYHLLPGHTYDKDPTVTVLKGSEESYVKMTVTVNKCKELDKIFADHQITDLTSVIGGYDATNWIYQGNTKDETRNTRTYEFWYKSTVSAGTNDVILDDLFETIKVPGELTNGEMETLQYKITVDEETDNITKTEEKLTITVNAYAIQASGFVASGGKTAEQVAWEAFDAQANS